jgi:CBS domain-containing protein
MEISTPIHVILARKGAEVWSVGPDDTVFDAIALMAQYDVGALPVIEYGRLLGMISERDYTRKVILLGRASRMTAVADIMTRELIVVGPRDTVQDGMRLMTENRVRHLPVIEGETMVGILSIGDVVNAIIGAQSAALEDMEHFVTGAYPA